MHVLRCSYPNIWSFLPLVAMLALVIINLQVSTQYGLIRGKFQKALINENVPQFWSGIRSLNRPPLPRRDATFYGILWYTVFGVIRATIVSTQAVISMACRYYLTLCLQARYLLGGRHVLYKMTQFETATIPNPDQRLTQDIDTFADTWAEVFRSANVSFLSQCRHTSSNFPPISARNVYRYFVRFGFSNLLFSRRPPPQ